MTYLIYHTTYISHTTNVKTNRCHRLTNVVLKHYFELGKDVYHQILGTAIAASLLHTMLTYL